MKRIPGVQTKTQPSQQSFTHLITLSHRIQLINQNKWRNLYHGNGVSGGDQLGNNGNGDLPSSMWRIFPIPLVAGDRVKSANFIVYSVATPADVEMCIALAREDFENQNPPALREHAKLLLNAQKNSVTTVTKDLDLVATSQDGLAIFIRALDLSQNANFSYRLVLEVERKLNDQSDVA